MIINCGQKSIIRFLRTLTNKSLVVLTDFIFALGVAIRFSFFTSRGFCIVGGRLDDETLIRNGALTPWVLRTGENWRHFFLLLLLIWHIEKDVIHILVADRGRKVSAALALESTASSLTSRCESFVRCSVARPLHRHLWLQGCTKAGSHTAPGSNIRLTQVEREVTAATFSRLNRLPTRKYKIKTRANL